MSNALCAGSGGGGDGWKEILVATKRWDSRTELGTTNKSLDIPLGSLPDSLDFDELFVIHDASFACSSTNNRMAFWSDILGKTNFFQATIDAPTPVVNIRKDRLRFERMLGYQNTKNYFYPPGNSQYDYLTDGDKIRIALSHQYGEPTTFYAEAGSYVTFKIYGRNYNL